MVYVIKTSYLGPKTSKSITLSGDDVPYFYIHSSVDSLFLISVCCEYWRTMNMDEKVPLGLGVDSFEYKLKSGEVDVVVDLFSNF